MTGGVGMTVERRGLQGDFGEGVAGGVAIWVAQTFLSAEVRYRQECLYYRA